MMMMMMKMGRTVCGCVFVDTCVYVCVFGRMCVCGCD